MAFTEGSNGLDTGQATTPAKSLPADQSGEVGDEDGQPRSGCQLLDDFAIFVQGVMALIALGSLFFKRMRERPQRPVKIWVFDVTKQALGALLVHTLNVLTSLIAGEISHRSHNPCVWYFLNVALDTTIGVLILFCWLRLITHLCTTYLNISHLQSGQYGDPPSLRIWFRQTTVFSTSLFMTKVVVVIMFKIFTFLETFATWILSPLHGNPRAEVAVVMLIFPLVMNVVQFWLIDSGIKGDSYTSDDKPVDEGAWQVLDVDDERNGAQGQDETTLKRNGSYEGLHQEWGSTSSSRTSLVTPKGDQQGT